MRSALAMLVMVGAAAGAIAQAPTAQDGVYSREQAKLGMVTYNSRCSACHDAGRMAPELWTDQFVAEWKDKKLSELFERISKTMPQDRPGSLSGEQALNVMAYLLQMNGFPAGAAAMSDPGALAGVTFVEP